MITIYVSVTTSFVRGFETSTGKIGSLKTDTNPNGRVGLRRTSICMYMYKFVFLCLYIRTGVFVRGVVTVVLFRVTNLLVVHGGGFPSSSCNQGCQRLTLDSCGIRLSSVGAGSGSRSGNVCIGLYSCTVFVTTPCHCRTATRSGRLSKGCRGVSRVKQCTFYPYFTERACHTYSLLITS